MRPDPTPESRPVPPLFKADKGTIAFAALPDGKIRLTYASWDDHKVVQRGQAFELQCGKQGVEARIIARVEEPEPDVDPFWIPDAPPAPDPRVVRGPGTVEHGDDPVGEAKRILFELNVPLMATDSFALPAWVIRGLLERIDEQPAALQHLSDIVDLMESDLDGLEIHPINSDVRRRITAMRDIIAKGNEHDAGPSAAPASTGGASEGAAG